VNRQIRILLSVFVIVLVTIVVNLTWVQIFGAAGIEGNAYNKRRLVEEYAIQRGDILTADGHQVAARSVDTRTEYRYQREYPMGPLFADVTGYDSWKYGRTAVEEKYNDILLGSGSMMTVRSLGNRLLGASKKGNSVVTTVDSRVQRAASEALGGRKGAVVAMDPTTGAVLAMVTSPTYDPNVAVPVRGNQAQWDAINADPNRPLFNRALNGLYPPGSSFKVVTGAAALGPGHRERGLAVRVRGKAGGERLHHL
jgi:peptidoglycan glycosyltransferase